MSGGALAIEGRFARSWRLTRVAWSVVRRDRSIMLLTASGTVLGLAAAFAIFGLSGYRPGDSLTVALVLWSVAFAWPLTFLATFVNVAVAAAAAAALDGERLGVRAALAVSVRRLRAIAAWSLLAAGVGVIVDEIAERLPWGGRLFEWLAGAAWTIATLFVVPVLALEDRGVRDSLRRSVALIRDRWGESAIGFATITAWTSIVAVPACLAVGVGLGIVGAGSGVLLAAGLVVLAVTIAIANAVEDVFSVALYRYASGAAAAGPFTERDLTRSVTRRGD